jgi:plastocyanin
LGSRTVVVVGLVCLAGASCGGNGTSSDVESSSSPTKFATSGAVPLPVDVPQNCPKPASKLEISAVNDSWIGPNGKPAKPGATCLIAPADEPFTVTLHNDIHSEGLFQVNHAFSVYTDSTGTDGLFNGDLVLAGDSFTYDVPSLGAGAYVFKCDIHPQNMTGVLVVE